MPRLILASASAARRRVLMDAGVDPVVIVSRVDEEALTATLGAIAPAELALVLARAKAEDVEQGIVSGRSTAAEPKYPGAGGPGAVDLGAVDGDAVDRGAADPDPVIVGCDSVFELDGVAYGKPLTPDVAIERITEMSGRSGLLHTGHWVIHHDRRVGRTTTTQVDFAQMSADEIAAYVATGEPLQVAGAFTLDGRAAPYVRGIVGDPSNVLGISLPTMRELVAQVGLSWQDLWTGTGSGAGG